MPAAAYGMTVEEFHRARAGRGFVQLIDGVMVVNSPGYPHGIAQGRLMVELGNWVDAGPGRGVAIPSMDIELTDRDLYIPDLAWIAEERVPEEPREKLPRIPDLAVEVSSPSTWRFDVGRKRFTYEAHGLPELWLIDMMAQSALVLRRTDPGAPTFDIELPLSAADVLRSPQLPSFELPVERLFRR